MTLWLRLLARLRQLEARHWTAMGASALLHLAILLGLQQVPPPPPQPVSFEIDLKAPEAEQIKRPKAKSSQAKPADKHQRKRLAKAKKRKPRIEPHTLEAELKQESRPRKDVPAVSLPKAETQAAQPGEETRPQVAAVRGGRQVAAAVTPGDTPASAVKAAQPGTQTAAVLAEPAGASQPAASPSEQSGEAGVALAVARSLAALAGGSLQGAEQSMSQGAAAQGGAAGPGAAGFSASGSAGEGLNLAAGRGANASSASEAPPLPGGEPQGLRLSASGTLSSLPEFAQGQGGLAAGQLAQDAGMASASDGQGRGQALASALAGGNSASPLSGPAGGPGKGGAGAAVERPASVGQASAPGQGAGRMAATPAVSKGLAGATPKRAAGSSQAARTLALAPGEPGSGPQWAIIMQPVQAALPASQGEDRKASGTAGGKVNQRTASAPAGGDTASGGAQGGPARLARTAAGQYASTGPASQVRGGGTEGARGVAPALGRTVPGGQTPGGNANVMSGIKPAEQKVMRADSRAETLDVLAPSTYCPVPIHAQPDNRPPAAQGDRLELPGYAANNPSFVYPMMANIYGVQGKLIVRVQVLPDGRPGEMLLKQSSGNSMLDKDAREQLARWRFTPARKNGQAVPAWIDVPVVYRLPEDRK